MAPTVRFHGIGGRTITKLRQFDLFAVAKFNPKVLILEIGSNDLCARNTDIPDLAANIFQLVQFLHFNFAVEHIIVSQILPRIKAPRLSPPYNVRVSELNRLLFHLLQTVPFATFWFHYPILRAKTSVFLRDGVHLNPHGNHLLYHSYQKALIRYLGHASQKRSNRHVPIFRRPPCRHRRPQPYHKPSPSFVHH